jgi:hypothetical protein
MGGKLLLEPRLCQRQRISPNHLAGIYSAIIRTIPFTFNLEKTMSYGDFTLTKIKKELGIEIIEGVTLFGSIKDLD